MTHFEAFLITKLDIVKGALFYCSSVAILLIFFFWFACKLRNEKLKIKNRLKLLPIIWLISVMIPSSKELAFIYFAPAIANNKDLKEITKKTPELLNLGLDYLEEKIKNK